MPGRSLGVLKVEATRTWVEPGVPARTTSRPWNWKMMSPGSPLASCRPGVELGTISSGSEASCSPSRSVTVTVPSWGCWGRSSSRPGGGGEGVGLGHETRQGDAVDLHLGAGAEAGADQLDVLGRAGGQGRHLGRGRWCRARRSPPAGKATPGTYSSTSVATAEVPEGVVTSKESESRPAAPGSGGEDRVGAGAAGDQRGLGRGGW